MQDWTQDSKQVELFMQRSESAGVSRRDFMKILAAAAGTSVLVAACGPAAVPAPSQGGESEAAAPVAVSPDNGTQYGVCEVSAGTARRRCQGVRPPAGQTPRHCGCRAQASTVLPAERGESVCPLQSGLLPAPQWTGLCPLTKRRQERSRGSDA